MSVVDVGKSIKSNMRMTYQKSSKDLKAVGVPLKPVNKKGIQQSKISTDLLSSKDFTLERSVSKGTMMVGSVELPLKSKQPATGMNAFKKQAKKGFYSKNTAVPKAANAGSHSRSVSKSSTKHTANKEPASRSTTSQSKIDASRAYDQKNRERNKQRENSIIKSAKKILYSSRSSKAYDMSARKSKDLGTERHGESVSSFQQSKIEDAITSKTYIEENACHEHASKGSKLPKGAKRVKPEGSLCMHRKGGKLTPADLECTFKPSINRNSRILDEKKQKSSVSPSPVNDRHNRLLNKGAEYAEKRKQRELLHKTREELRNERECSFKPTKLAHYEGAASHELPIEERSEAWKKRRDERIAKQRRELQQRAEEEIREQTAQYNEGNGVNSYEPEGTHRRTAKDYISGSPVRSRDGKIMVGNYTSKRGLMTDDEYVNVRLDNIRRSIENQMSYADSQRSWSRSKSRDQ